MNQLQVVETKFPKVVQGFGPRVLRDMKSGEFVMVTGADTIRSRHPSQESAEEACLAFEAATGRQAICEVGYTPQMVDAMGTAVARNPWPGKGQSWMHAD